MSLIALGVVLLGFALHPFVTYPLSLLVLRPRSRRAAPRQPAATRPSVAICMSVYNEQDVVVEKVRRLIEQAEAYGPATIHVYADGCTDDTVELLAPFADRVNLIASATRSGKTAGMGALLAASDSELVMFTDANVRAPVSALIDLVEPLRDPTVGCVTARLVYSNEGETATSALGARYWQLEEWIKRLEDEAYGLIGVDGAMFVIRRENYHLPPPNLIDDLFVSLKVLIDGKRVTRVPQVTITERSATASVEEHRRKARIACQGMNVHRALWPALRQMHPVLVYGYLSHRLIKWLMPFFLLGAVLCFAAALAIYTSLMAVAAGLIGLALVLLIGNLVRVRIAEFAWSSIASLAGVARGVVQSLLMRQTYTVWEPAASVRQRIND
ncbi:MULTISPECIES: glycosyltransferase [unclassified Sphingomonas]|uniref:glycosyltransferase n=1 Tax=unclassified Sphingomonas TaxID=196159 RepID=UPI00082AB70F|nr:MULTISPECIES: glycosyltransferase [unclassified Sphingomonas]MCH4891690.1 glycosyltransferase [Sphingomonas sp. SFZ2018-12]